MVLLCNSLLRKCAPEQMSWSAAERAILCTTKKFVKSISTRIMSQPIKLIGNLQRTSYRFSFVDVTLQVDALFEVVHSAKNWRSRRCTSYAWRTVLIVQRTETVLYHIFPEILVCGFLARFIGFSLSASRFGMAIWNDWKRKSSRQEVTHKSGNWTECYDWSAD